MDKILVTREELDEALDDQSDVILDAVFKLIDEENNKTTKKLMPIAAALTMLIREVGLSETIAKQLRDEDIVGEGDAPDELFSAFSEVIAAMKKANAK